MSNENDKIKELTKELELLESKVNNLEEDNKHLLDRIHHLTEDIKVEPHSTRIKQAIVVDENDAYNTSFDDSRNFNTSKNFGLFINYHWRSIISSKIFWILLVVIPMIFTMLWHIIYSMSYASEGGFLFGGKDEKEVIAMKLAGVISNWLIAVPILVLGCIVLPSFLVSSRESNLLKRLSINSMNKNQIFWFYVTSSLMVFIGYFMVMLGGWLFALSLLANAINKGPVWETSHSMFADVQKFRLFTLTFISMLGIIALGFYRAMTVKSSKVFVAWGTGIFIFSQIVKISLQILGLKPYDADIVLDSWLGEFLIMTLMFVVKWLFLLTIPTIMFISISTVTLGESKFAFVPQFHDAWIDSSVIFGVLQILIILISITIFVLVWYFRKRIISYELGR